MDALPVELVAAVFRLLGLKDCITVSHVCKRWRTAAIDDPLLWTRVAVDMAPIEGVETLVARSRDAPLSLTVGAFVKGEEDRVARVLSENMGRIHALCLQTTLRCYTDSFRQSLCSPAPRMVIFSIHVHDDNMDGNDDGDTAVTLPSLLFAGLAPSLSRVELRGAELPSTCPALTSAFSLVLQLPDLLPEEPLCLSDMFPNLLSLELTNQSEEPYVSLKPGHRLLALDMVATLEPDADLRASLLALNHADLFSIKASTTDADTLALVFDGTRDVCSLSLGRNNPKYDERWDTTHPTASVSFGSAGFLRHFRIAEEPAVAALLAAPVRVAALTLLNIAHHLLRLSSAVLPSLTRLYVEFPCEDVEMDYGHLAQWLDAQRTPRLQTLILCGEWYPASELGYCPLTQPRVLSAARLAACLKTRPTPPLFELRLRVEMEETPEAAYELLSPTVLSFSPF